MAQLEQQPRGLTRLIYEALVSHSPTLAAEGESWTPEVMSRVEEDLKRQFSTRNTMREQLIFNMVFHRAFNEAADLVMRDPALNPSARPTGRSAYPRAVSATA